MQTLQPVLLYGRYEWQRDLQPVAEFEARLESVYSVMRANGWDALIVHGDSRENAALCHLTNAVPKRWGLALIAPDRLPRLSLPSGRATCRPYGDSPGSRTSVRRARSALRCCNG